MAGAVAWRHADGRYVASARRASVIIAHGATLRVRERPRKAAAYMRMAHRRPSARLLKYYAIQHDLPRNFRRRRADSPMRALG